MVQQRMHKGWSVAAAARAMHHSSTWVFNCEQGNIVAPKLSTQREIAKAFGLPLSDVRAALALPPIDDPETDALHATLNELTNVLQSAHPARYAAIVDAARLVASVP